MGYRNGRGEAATLAVGSGSQYVFDPSIDVDALGGVHVSYQDGYGMWYVKRSQGVWGAALYLGGGERPRISADSSGNWHLVYQASNRILYRNGRGEAATLAVGSGAQYVFDPSIDVDALGYGAHVTYQGGYQIWYKRITPAVPGARSPFRP